MPAANHSTRHAAPVVRPMRADENARVERFFREAGYPVPLGSDYVAWGAWEGEALVGCIALCIEGGVTILRGPEIAYDRRRRGIGKALMEAVRPGIAARPCYCIAYTHLHRMYREAGFRRCAEGEGPEFLRRRVRDMRARKWDLALLFRPADEGAASND